MEKTNLLEELCNEGLALRIERSKIFILDDIANEVREKLKSPMNKEEFCSWFEKFIAERKIQLTTLPYTRGW